MPTWIIQLGAAVAGLLAGALYYSVLARYSKNNKLFFRAILVSALTIFMVHLCADYYVVSRISAGEGNFFTKLTIAFTHSLELFAFQTYYFDNGYQEFFFGIQPELPGHPWMAYLFTILFVLASLSSISLVIRAFNRRRSSREWLSANIKKTANTHIFFHAGELSALLAADVRRARPGENLIAVGFPDPEEAYIDLSVWEKIKRLFQTRNDNPGGPFDAVIYSSMFLWDASGPDAIDQMNLKELAPFLQDPSCSIYILDDEQERNLRSAEILHRAGCKAAVYCRACRGGINRMYEDAMTCTPSVNVRLMDYAGLAIRKVKDTPALLPVNFVKKGTDAQGRPEGWVDSAFNSMVIGFGETGQEALRYLFEFGAFVGKDYKKAPFTCTVIDSQMDLIAPSFRKHYPALTEAAGVTYLPSKTGSAGYWDAIARLMPTLNYIIICLGDDRLNLCVAADLAEYACRTGKDTGQNFAILVKQEDPTHLDTITLKHYNSVAQYHSCIHAFGAREEVWTYDNITDGSITERAKAFHAGYLRAQDTTESPDMLWNNREKEIVSTPDFAVHSKLVRHRNQDFANCFNIPVKLALLGPDDLARRHELAASIPSKWETTHYLGSDPHEEKLLHYMAVHEHLRWEASHGALGYAPGKETDDVLKTHACIMDYDSLSEEMKHYDYLVIKTTLEL